MVTELKKENNLKIIDSPSVYGSRLKNLQELRKTRTFCDVILQVENKEIYAHRSILACCSPYFFDLFTADDDMKTASEDKLIYKLNGVFEYNSLENLITYAYTGELEVVPSEIKALYTTACKLKMDSVARTSGEYLIGTLTPETCLEMRAIHGVSGDEYLVSAIDNYIQQQPDLSHVTEEAHDVPRLLVNVIHHSKDEASMRTRALCSLALEWVRKQIEEEDLTLQQLSEKTHLLYLNVDNSFHDCSDIESGAVNDSEVIQDYKKISRKTSQVSMKVRRKTPSGPQPAKPRMMLFSRSISDESETRGDDWKLVAHDRLADNSVIGIVALNNVVAILSIQQIVDEQLDESASTSRLSPVEKVDSYTMIPLMNSPKCASGVGTLGGKLLVCGGYDRGECLSFVEGYDPLTNTWEALPSMNQNRGRFDLTVVDGRAFAVGGCDGTQELSSVEVLDRDFTRWDYVSPLPLARSNIGVCSLNGKVFCIGGWNGQFGIRQCDEFDPETYCWRTIDSLHSGRYQAGVVSLLGKIYVVGGCDSWNCLNSVEIFDPTVEAWKLGPSMNTPRRGCGVAALNNLIYVVGGSDGSHSLCTTEIYDPETNSWTPGPSMSSCRSNVGVSVLDGRLYAVGGFSGKNFLNSIEYLDPQTNEWTTFIPKPPENEQHEHEHDIENGVRSKETADIGTTNKHAQNGFKGYKKSEAIQVVSPENGNRSKIINFREDFSSSSNCDWEENELDVSGNYPDFHSCSISH